MHGGKSNTQPAREPSPKRRLNSQWGDNGSSSNGESSTANVWTTQQPSQQKQLSIGNQPAILEHSTMDMNLALRQQMPLPGTPQYPAPIWVSRVHEHRGDILEFMNKQPRIIGNSVMDDASVCGIIPGENRM